MENLITHIFNYNPFFGLVITSIITVVFTSSIVYLLFFFKDKKIKKLSLSGLEFENDVILKKEEKTSIDVAFLMLRYKINRIINNNLQLLKVKDEGKKMLIIDLLTITLETFAEFIEKNQEAKNKNCNSYIKSLDEAIIEYEMRARKHGIPDLAIKRFRLWRIKYLSHVSVAIADICASNLYNTEQDKELSILVVINYAIEMIITSAEQLSTVINGQLKGTTYKNHTIQE